MRTFAELLVEYTQRAGISDAELARSTGVQRQTIFRWKEGLVARPRYREDVLRIATKLRLTPAERDELLLAGGFPPDEAQPSAVNASPIAPANAGRDAEAAARQTDGSTQEPNLAPPPVRPPRLFPTPGRLLGVAVVLMLGVALFGGFVLPRLLPPVPPPTAPAITPAPAPTPTLIVAASGQKMVLVAPFVGYTSGELRFNVAGRIAETLDDAVRQARLRSVDIVVLEAPLATDEQARTMLEQTGAAAVIWGEYDAGRVRASITMRNEAAAWVNPVDSPAQLALAINEAAPSAAQALAFYALGRVYRDESEAATALQLFQQALALNPSDRGMRASLHFYVGALLPVVEGETAPVISQAIESYTAAFALRPDWENIQYNRGTALLGRALLSSDERADLDAAIVDLSAVITRLPQNPAPRINRGIAYYQRNDAGDAAAAVADLSAALELEPTNARSYYHRALAQLRAAPDESWLSDMQRASELAPNDPTIDNGFCWGYGVSAQPETALPACNAAVSADPTGASLDSRAIVYGQLGRYAEAAADLEDYLGWVRRTYPDLYAKYRGPQAETWIAALRNGLNPFDAATLTTLRLGK